MKRQLLQLSYACALFSMLTSCHTTKKYAAVGKSPKSGKSSSRQPKFINDIYISGHNKSSATPNAIEPARRPEKIKSIYVAPVPVKAIPKPATETYYASTAIDKSVTAVKDNTYTLPSEPILITDASELKNKYADLLGIKPKEITNYPLYNFIDRWYGTNYRLGGCDKSGIDCSGFAQKLYGEVYGIDLLRTAMEQFANCKRIKKADDAEEGDLVFFKVHSKRITHVGVYLSNNYFIHASTSGGVMISNLNEEYWHKHYAGCGRIPKTN